MMGGWLSTVSKDTTLRVWDVSSPHASRCVAIGKGHTEAVGGCFGKGGNGGTLLPLTGSKDRTIKSWDVSVLALGMHGVIDLSVSSAVRAHEKDINAMAMAPYAHGSRTSTSPARPLIAQSSSGKSTERRGQCILQVSSADTKEGYGRSISLQRRDA